jgi:hypothetical protein
MKRAYALDPMSVITLSFRQTLKRVLLWGRLGVWRIAFSLPIVTIPAAKAAFYQAVAEALRDPFDQNINPREAFVRGFFDHAARATAVAVLNLFAFVVIAFAILFWSAQEPFYLNLLAGIALPFLLLWWMCQPHLYPALVEHAHLPVLGLLKLVIRLALRHPLYSFVAVFSLNWLFLLTLPLIGPLSLMVIPFLALVSTQAYWVTADITLPDLVDPVRYAEMQEETGKPKVGSAGSRE